MAYIPGENLRKCDRQSLTCVLDSLIAMQETCWDQGETYSGDYFAHTLQGREDRANYLNDPQLEAAYAAFLREYQALPRTLCHDDLLPFNVLCDGKRAVFIDWECGGILPYPVSLARFLAHCEETEDAFFYMKAEDKSYAIDYYFEKFISQKGIAKKHYLHSMDLFFFYEHCEWIFLGNKYGNKAMPRFQDYLKKAKQLAQRLGY